MAAVNEAPPISSYTKEKVARAKFTLEHYYNNLVNETEERENRYVLAGAQRSSCKNFLRCILFLFFFISFFVFVFACKRVVIFLSTFGKKL